MKYLQTGIALLMLGCPCCSGTPSGLQGNTGTGGQSTQVGPSATAGASAGLSGVTHGSDLTFAQVGPAGLGVASSELRKTTVGDARISTWPSDGLPAWIPNAPYVYNNDPNNHGGIVPKGGLRIDGFEVPSGAWVAQFDDFANDSIIVSGDNAGTSPAFAGVVFRGCRWRGAATAPGFISVYANSHTNIWILYSDAGGLGAADAEYNEVAFSTNDDTSNIVFYRNYISYTSTGIQPGMPGPQIIENFIDKVTFFYGEAGPPNEGGPKHLNGISLNGGQTNALILRNKVLLESPDEAGRSISQTDAIALFQDFGAFPGSGVNLDGSLGYSIKDNYVGGGGYCFYAGMNSGKAADSVQNLVLTGNRVTTQWWPQGGSWGPLAAEPSWGTFGNIKSNNTFAESGAAW